jgi:hypothetical protein
MLARALIVIFCASFATTAQAATLCVNPGGTGGCYSAIQAAVDVAIDDDLIEIEAGTYVGSVVVVAKELTIVGAGAGSVVITSPNTNALVQVGQKGELTLSGVSIQNSDGWGVGVFEGKLTLSDATVEDSYDSGIRVSLGKLWVSDTIIMNNGSAGIIAGRGARATVNNASISGNGSAFPYDGGGIRAGSHDTKLRITNTTISGNVASSQGGGVSSLGSLRMDSCTVSGNTEGAIWIRRKARITRSTIVDNFTGSIYVAGGVSIDSPSFAPQQAQLLLSGSIIANNTGASYGDCYGPVRSRNFNVIEDTSACSFPGGLRANDVTGQDPVLGPLAPNGGPTQTHELLAGSPALGNMPSKKFCDVDQRGEPRTDPCDSGAYEAP